MLDILLSQPGLLMPGAESRAAGPWAARLQVKTNALDANAFTMSGGNQQKVVIAKWLATEPRLLIIDEPTRGIDVGSKNDIYLLLRALADSGVALLMISSDMEEVIGVCDRVAVMHEGGIAGILERPGFSEQNVLRLAVGATETA